MAALIAAKERSMTIDTAGTATATPHVAPVAPTPAPAKKDTNRAKATPKARKRAKVGKPTKKPVAQRKGSKASQAVAMLQRKNGATLQELMDKMRWQRHTVRGLVAGTIKRAGYKVESFKSDKGERTYRIK